MIERSSPSPKQGATARPDALLVRLPHVIPRESKPIRRVTEEQIMRWLLLSIVLVMSGCVLGESGHGPQMLLEDAANDLIQGDLHDPMPGPEQ